MTTLTATLQTIHNYRTSNVLLFTAWQRSNLCYVVRTGLRRRVAHTRTVSLALFCSWRCYKHFTRNISINIHKLLQATLQSTAAQEQHSKNQRSPFPSCQPLRSLTSHFTHFEDASFDTINCTATILIAKLIIL